MLSLINVFPAIKEHFKSLEEDSSCLITTLLFFLIPLGFASVIIYNGFVVSDNILNYMLTSFSIFIGLITNFLVLLIDRKEKTKLRQDLIEHLAFNSIYELIIGIFVLIFAIALLFVNNSIAINILSFILYLLVFNFIITLLMIARRFFVLFKNNLEE